MTQWKALQDQHWHSKSSPARAPRLPMSARSEFPKDSVVTPLASQDAMPFTQSSGLRLCKTQGRGFGVLSFHQMLRRCPSRIRPKQMALEPFPCSRLVGIEHHDAVLLEGLDGHLVGLSSNPREPGFSQAPIDGFPARFCGSPALAAQKQPLENSGP